MLAKLVWFPIETVREKLFHASLLASGGCLQCFEFLGLQPNHSNLASIFTWSSYKDTSHEIYGPL